MFSQIVISGFRKKETANNLQEISFALEACKTSKVTGISLYTEGVFLNVMEGNDAQTSAIFNAFQKDLRFSEVMIILKNNNPSREFDDYRTGVTEIDINDTIPHIFHLNAGSYKRYLSKNVSSDIVTLIDAFARVNLLQ